MANISVPDAVFPGFKTIKNLSDEQLAKLIDYLNNFVIGKKFSDVADELEDLINVDGNALFQTILSFSSLVSEEVDLTDLSKNLSESYRELSKSNFNIKELNTLKTNILQIVSNYSKINIAVKARDYRVHDANTLREFRLLTDVRLLFENDTQDSDKYGIILHKLSFEYFGSLPFNDLHLNVTLEDLVNLKSEIEKAIERDRSFRNSFNGNLNLI